MKSVCWLNSNLSRFKELSDEECHQVLLIAKMGLFTTDNSIVSDCLWAISYVADTCNDDLIALVCAGETLQSIISGVSN